MYRIEEQVEDYKRSSVRTFYVISPLAIIRTLDDISRSLVHKLTEEVCQTRNQIPKIHIYKLGIKENIVQQLSQVGFTITTVHDKNLMKLIILTIEENPELWEDYV